MIDEEFIALGRRFGKTEYIGELMEDQSKPKYEKVYRIWDVENRCWLKTSKGHSYWAGISTAKGIATYYQNNYSSYYNEDQTIKYIIKEFNLVPEE